MFFFNVRNSYHCFHIQPTAPRFPVIIFKPNDLRGFLLPSKTCLLQNCLLTTRAHSKLMLPISFAQLKREEFVKHGAIGRLTFRTTIRLVLGGARDLDSLARFSRSRYRSPSYISGVISRSDVYKECSAHL